jgi:DNA-binding NarL/FixJ family response regulator
MKPVTPIRVLVADDNAVVRHGLAKLLKEEGDFLFIGEARNGREAVAMARSLVPDVVLMDISMPVMNGLDATRQILAAKPSAKVIILSAYDDIEYVNRAKAGGAAGYLTKMTFTDTLARAIRDAVKGCPFFSPSTGEGTPPKPPGASGRRGGKETKNRGLTSRESTILRLRAGGAGNDQVAAKLCISVDDVETHLTNLTGKLGISRPDDLLGFGFPA